MHLQYADSPPTGNKMMLMMGTNGSPNDSNAYSNPLQLSLGIHSSLPPPGLMGAAAPAYESAHSISSSTSSNTNMHHQFGASRFMQRRNSTSVPPSVDEMSGFDSVLHSEDPLLNPSYKNNANSQHAGILNMHHHLHHPLPTAYQHDAPQFDQHQFLLDGTLARHHQQQHSLSAQQQAQQQQQLKGTRSQHASGGSAQNANASNPQELPAFSAAESVLRFLAATDCGELPPPPSSGSQHFEDRRSHHSNSHNSNNNHNLPGTGTDDSDNVFLERFSDLSIRDHLPPLREDYGFYPSQDPLNAGMIGMYTPRGTEHNLPETTNSVIRPFLFDTFLGTSAELGLSADDYRYQAMSSLENNNASNHNPYFSSGNRHSYMPPSSRDYEEMEVGSLYGLGKPYSAVPPPGYICKLCFVEGHWLKNCNLYQARRRTPDFLPFFPASANNSNGSTARQPQKTTIPPDGYVCRKCNTPGHCSARCPSSQFLPTVTLAKYVS
ncbi:hypothetical protein DFJ77DRAFT_327733 [Powellomyces hirtus]|nr:hypothetical protein DFJ77DRAFT_327733 [Powellomyces hirtus]